MRQPGLGPRLEAVLGLVGQAEVVADVGTGDGRLAVALLGRGYARRVIATERVPGPLAAAAHMVRAAGMEGCIELRLGDGLGALRPGEAQVIVIAGMGGLSIATILSRAEALARACPRLVLQPLKDPAPVRRQLRRSGFGIVREDLALEDGRYYPVLVAVPGARGSAPYPGLGPLNDELGPFLLRTRHPLLPGLVAAKLAESARVLAALERACDPHPARRRYWERRRSRLEEALRCWQQ